MPSIFKKNVSRSAVNTKKNVLNGNVWAPAEKEAEVLPSWSVVSSDIDRIIKKNRRV